MNIKILFICFVLMIFGTVYAADNYIQKGSDGSSLENANAYDKSGTIGINTSTNPDTNYKLDVNGYFEASGFKTRLLRDANYPMVVGGTNNAVLHYVEGATISGGRDHNIGYQANWSTVGGGYDNEIWNLNGTICGGRNGYIDGDNGPEYAFIGGGVDNRLASGPDYSVLVGGESNRLTAITTDQADYAVLVGGYENQITGTSHYAVIGGGKNNNTDDGLYSTICGGNSNVASGTGATVWGYNNDATGNYSTAGGGGVDATGICSTAIGYGSYATEDYTCALGSGAHADDAYSFVWSGEPSCYSGKNHQFKVCADNGAWFSEEVSALCFEDRPGGCSKSMGSYPDLETAYNAVMSMNPSPGDPSQLDYENLDPFISSEGPEGEISRNVSATVTAQIVVLKDLIARTALLEQSAAGDQ